MREEGQLEGRYSVYYKVTNVEGHLEFIKKTSNTMVLGLDFFFLKKKKLCEVWSYLLKGSNITF